MKTLVVYESMYGNTHQLAEVIGQALTSLGHVDVVSARNVDPVTFETADFIVAGAPTHAHSMPRAKTRDVARNQVQSSTDLQLDPSAEGPGLREWLSTLGWKGRSRPAAAFDTRQDAAALLTGRASKVISRRLHRAGFVMIAEPESFLVDAHAALDPSELKRAEHWANGLAFALAQQQKAPAAV